MRYLRVLSLMIVILGAALHADAATATWDRNPESNVVGYRLAYGTSAGSHPTIIDVGNVTTYPLSLAPGRYYVVVRAYDNTGLTSPDSVEVVVDVASTTNQAPNFTQPANQTSVQNTAASLALVASDPEGTAVTFSATGLAPGLSLNASTGVIGGTATTAGVYSVIATASDGSLFTSRAFSWTVTAPNQAPVLNQPANQTSVQNTAASLALVASDPNGNTITFSATGLPPGLSVNASTGVIAGTVTTIGTYTVTASASDGSLSASRTFTWSVTAPNQAPIFTQPANQTSVQNTAASLALIASDPNGNTVTFTATGLPPGLALNASTGVIAGTATTVGVYSIIATASDGSLFTSRAFTWTVTAPNQAPVLNQPANQTSVQNTAASLTLVASDPNGNTITFSATGLPPGLSVNASTGVIAGTVTTVGTYNVTASASDGSLSASRTFTWSVTTQNQAPTLTQPMDQASVQNANVSLALVASDPEGTALTFDATGLPPGLGVNASTGVIAGTATTVGTYSVTATASDGSLTASRTFMWTVTASSGSITLTLSPVDTYLNLNSTNFSTDRQLNTYTWPSNRVANVILMKFDLSQIPANATVQSAALQLALIGVDSATNDPTYTVSLHQVINRNPDITRATGLTADGVTAWTANNCCQANIPLAQSDLSPARAANAVNRTLGFKTWDALAIVEAWRSAPATNFGLALNSDATKPQDRYRFFASMENTTVANRPSLRITYTVPGTVDTTAPTVGIGAPTNGATVLGTAVAVSATATDAVGVVGVQFRLDGVALGSEDTTSPYSTTWDTTTIANGSHVLTAVARDAAGNSTTSVAVTVTVSNPLPNRAPTLVQPVNQTSAEGSLTSLALVGADPDGNPLTYSATGLPGGLTVNPTTGVISGTLSFTSAGAYTVAATVSDGMLSQSRSFTWTVTNTNRPPVLSQPTNQVNMVGTVVSVPLSATDPDGTALSYQASGLPAGLAVNTTSGVIAGTLSSTSDGVYTVTATASDGQLTASRTFIWSVSNSDAPVQGDFDGDGKDDPGTYRESTGEWRVWLSSNNFVLGTPIVWGGGSDVPVPADYDGDHKTDIAVFRFATGTWHVLLSSSNMQSGLDLQWGNASDRPVPVDYDGDGRADLALPRFGGFEILLSSTNYLTSVTVR